MIKPIVHEIAIKALEEIRDTQGKVCQEFEICDCVGCKSSYASWAIADKALQCLASTTQNEGGNTMREKLASLAHEMWSEWMKYLFSKCIQPTYNSTLIIPASAVNRWSRQMKTPYSELSEEEKESDRREADRMLECISVLDSHSYGAKKWYESREGILKRWDIWRRYIASGGRSSWPRDEFESLLDYLFKQ